MPTQIRCQQTCRLTSLNDVLNSACTVLVRSHDVCRIDLSPSTFQTHWQIEVQSNQVSQAFVVELGCQGSESESRGSLSVLKGLCQWRKSKQNKENFILIGAQSLSKI